MTTPRLTILGGGDEIGANCYLLEWGGDSYLLDAGRHPGVRGDRDHPWRDFFSLPDLERLTHAPRAILISHAHQDHIGSLPVISRLFPGTPIYATTASADLIPLMLADASRIQRLYDPRARDYDPDFHWETFLDREDLDAVAANLRLHAVEPRRPVNLPGGLRATFLPNSHVLGSAGILLERDGYRLFYTGDFSLTKQELHTATELPPPDSVDTLLMESTYGDREPGLDREGAHQALGEFVAGRVAEGGSVLIPAFALGRAQDLLAALARHKAEGVLPADLPVHVLGLSRAVTEIYHRQQAHLSPNLPGLDLLAAATPLDGIRWPLLAGSRGGRRLRGEERDKALVAELKAFLDERPRVLLATSGMLNPGSLAWSGARVVAGDTRHGLLFVGWLPPHSLGGRLLAAQVGETVHVGRPPYPGAEAIQVLRRNPHVARISYSAHAGKADLARAVEAISPKNVILVHGDAAARQGLEDALEARYPIHLPARRGTLLLHNDGPDRVEDISSVPALVLVHGRSLWERARTVLGLDDPDETHLLGWLERENALQACRETALLERHPGPERAWIHLLGGSAPGSHRIRRVLQTWLTRQGRRVAIHALPGGATPRQMGEAVADLLAAHHPASQLLLCADDPVLFHKCALAAAFLDRDLLLLDERNQPALQPRPPLAVDPGPFREHAALLEDLLYPERDRDPRPDLAKLPPALRDCLEWDEDMRRFAWSDYGRLLRRRWLQDVDEAVLREG